MFVIKNGYIGMFWSCSGNLYVDADTVIFPDRKECLTFLSGKTDVDHAVKIIMNMKKKPDTWFSFALC